MLALAVTGLIFPTLFHATHSGAAAVVRELHFSEAVAVVLHPLQQRFDRLGAEIEPAVAAARCQCVSLVDEEHTARGRGDDLCRLCRGLPEVAGHQF